MPCIRRYVNNVNLGAENGVSRKVQEQKQRRLILRRLGSDKLEAPRAGPEGAGGRAGWRLPRVRPVLSLSLPPLVGPQARSGVGSDTRQTADKGLITGTHK